MTRILVDLWCWNDNNFIAYDTKADLRYDATNHSTKCMYDVSFCRNGGYGILSHDTTNNIYNLSYSFDNTGNQLTQTLLLNIGSLERRGSITNYNVEVTGTVMNNDTLNVTAITVHSSYIMVTGILVDLWCWYDNNFIAFDTKADLRNDPSNHTAMCMYDVAACRNGGYGILINESSVDNMYRLHWEFDNNGNSIIEYILLNMGSTQDRMNISNVIVTVIGTSMNTTSKILTVTSVEYDGTTYDSNSITTTTTTAPVTTTTTTTTAATSNGVIISFIVGFMALFLNILFV